MKINNICCPLCNTDKLNVKEIIYNGTIMQCRLCTVKFFIKNKSD